MIADSELNSCSESCLTLFMQLKYQEAKRLLAKALDIRKNILGREHPVVTQTLHDFGLVLLDEVCHRRYPKVYNTTCLNCFLLR